MLHEFVQALQFTTIWLFLWAIRKALIVGTMHIELLNEKVQEIIEIIATKRDLK